MVHIVAMRMRTRPPRLLHDPPPCSSPLFSTRAGDARGHSQVDCGERLCRVRRGDSHPVRRLGQRQERARPVQAA
eukprot:291590-Pleurochrysis_carterae.AAC.1